MERQHSTAQEWGLGSLGIQDLGSDSRKPNLDSQLFHFFLVVRNFLCLFPYQLLGVNNSTYATGDDKNSDSTNYFLKIEMRAMQKNEIGPLSYIIYKNQLKIDKDLNVRVELIKS